VQLFLPFLVQFLSLLYESIARFKLSVKMLADFLFWALFSRATGKCPKNARNFFLWAYLGLIFVKDADVHNHNDDDVLFN
jgi:hypothetical protein